MHYSNRSGVFEARAAAVQNKSTYDRHMKAKLEGKTCIDCHKGIAHELPKGC